MPWFAIMLHGSQICIPGSGDEPIIGFYTTRVVRSANAEEAAEKAVTMVMQDWQTDEYKNIGEISQMRVEVESIDRLKFIERLFRKIPNKGHTFYLSDEDEQAGHEEGAS